MVPTHRRGLCQRHRQVERPPAWRSRGGQIFVPDGDAPRPALRRLSLPRRAHQLCGLAVFPVPAELADGRRDAGCSRHSVTYETIRQWGLKFGQEFANRIRRRAPRRGDKWHLDEVVLSIAGKKHWRWRAADQEGFARCPRPEPARQEGRQALARERKGNIGHRRGMASSRCRARPPDVLAQT